MNDIRFSLLNLLDILTRILMVIGFLLVWRRLTVMELRGTNMMEAAAFERKLLANIMGVDLGTSPFTVAAQAPA